MRILVPAFLALTACQPGPPDNAAEIAGNAEAGIVTPEPGEAPETAESATNSPATATLGPLRIRYDAAALAPAEAEVALPPDWSRKVVGLKLIARDRLELMGKAECIYGGAGEARPCNIVQEAGLAFALIDEGFDSAARRIPDDQSRPINLAGAEGVAWQIGAEGEGAEYILLPAGARTLLVVRQYRSSGNPDEDALGAVLADLSLAR